MLQLVCWTAHRKTLLQAKLMRVTGDSLSKLPDARSVPELLKARAAICSIPNKVFDQMRLVKHRSASFTGYAY